MKRKNNLYQLFCSKENIGAAFDAAKKGKRHYREVQTIEANRENVRASYWGWLKHADSYRLTEKYLNNEGKFKHTA